MREREEPVPTTRGERRFEMTTVKLTASYVRYLVTSLATIAFGIYMN
jgi:hypothetical protein